MKANFLKAAGVKTEAEFLAKYPTEASFFKAHPEMKSEIAVDPRAKDFDAFLAQPGVKEALTAIAKKHNWTPERLLAVIHAETGGSMDPAQKNKSTKNGSAVGLIQFTPTIIKELGYTKEQVKNMSPAEQLSGPVAAYFDKYSKGAKDPYVVVAGSSLGNKPASHEAFPVGSKGYNANKAWRGPDGKITVKSISNTVKTPKNYSVAAAPAPTPIDPEKAKKQQLHAIWDKDPNARGIWTNNDRQGREAVNTKKINRAIAEYSLTGSTPGTGAGLIAGWIEEKFSPMQRLENTFGSGKGKNLQEVGYTNDAVKKGIEGMLNYMKGEGHVTYSVADAFRTMDAWQSKVLTGQDTDASIPMAIIDILSGESPAQQKAIIEGAKRKGYLGKGINAEKTEYNIYRMLKKPEEYYTTQMTGNNAANIAMLVKNPKAVVQVLKTGGKAIIGGAVLTKAGIKGAIKAMKNSTLPGIPTLVNKISSAFEEGYRLQPGDTAESLAALGKTLDEAGLVAPKTSKTWAQHYKDTYNVLKTLPDNVRKSLTGKSFKEIAEIRSSIERTLGMPASDVMRLSKEELGTLYKAQFAKAEIKIAEALAQKTKALEAIGPAKQQLAAAKEAFKKARAGAPNTSIAEAEKALKSAQAALDKSREAVKKAFSKEPLYDTHWENIAKLEKLEVAPEYASKFRVLEKMEQGIARHVAKLQKLGDVPAEIAATSTRHHKALKAAQAADALVSAKTGLSSASKNARAAEAGIEAAVNSANKADEFLANIKKSPDLLKALGKDMDAIRKLKDPVKSAIIVARAARSIGMSPEAVKQETGIELPKDDFSPNPVTDTSTGEDGTGQGTGDSGSPGSGGGTGGGSEDTTGAGGEGATTDTATGTAKTDAQAKTKANSVTGASVGSGTTPEKVPFIQKANDVLGTLASYAPAIYNLSKGMQPVEKAPRRFITPQEQVYKNLSQDQLNLIDDAFSTAVGNSRNMSGGMMSNFRSNIEAAWADKIRASSAVNAQEALRADQVAGANVASKAQADMFNAQVASQADQLDMQSKAVRDSFFAQGMQDLQNIGYRNKTDAAKAKMQDIALKALATGQYSIKEDGSIVFNKPTAPVPTASATAGASTPTTGRAVTVPILDKPALPTEPEEELLTQKYPWSFVPDED